MAANPDRPGRTCSLLQASWTLFFHNEPVAGFHNADPATAVGLVAKF